MPIIGLDIGKHSFRAVELEKHKGFFVLKNYGEYQGSDLDLNFNSTEQINKYSLEIKNFIKDHDFSTSEVVVALPEKDVFTRVINAPMMSKRELNDFIMLGSDEYIPLPIEEVTFDAQIIGKKKDKSGNESLNILLVAAKNDVLNQYIDFIKSAGLNPKGLEPETLSIERVLGDSIERPSASIIINIGLLSSQIIITYKGFVRFTRSLSIGGDEFTKAVQKGLNLDYHQAEEYKKAYGLDESQVEGKVFQALAPLFDTVLEEINRSKIYYTTHNPDVIINRVILSGGTALMPGLLLYVANKLSVEAELANPWRNIKLSEKLEKFRDQLLEAGPIYTTSVGLALKEI